MVFAGGLGARIDLKAVSVGDEDVSGVARLFSESNTRFLCEVTAEKATAFENVLAGVRFAKVGEVTDSARLVITESNLTLIDADVPALKQAWQATFRY
jgi:phosphoribosylformylglycinamidine synthase